MSAVYPVATSLLDGNHRSERLALHIETRTVPWLETWTLISIPAMNRVDRQQERRVEIEHIEAAMSQH